MASCLQKIPSGNESRARKEKMMKWVFQTLAIDRAWNNYEIKRAESIKFLVVLLDENLTWEPHIKYIENKIAENTGL